MAAHRISVIWGGHRQPGTLGWRSCQPLVGGCWRAGSWLSRAALALSAAAALASCLCRIAAVTCPCVLRHLSTLQGFPSPPEIHGTGISGSPGCQGFVGMGGSEALPPPPRPGVLPALFAGCSLRLCPELSAWSSPTVLPRAPAAWVLQSLNPLLRVEGRDPGRCCLPPGSSSSCLLSLFWVLSVSTIARDFRLGGGYCHAL